LQRAQRVEPHVGAGGVGVDAEARDGAEGRGGLAGQGLAVGGGGDVDVAALGVGQDEQTLGLRLLDDEFEDAPAVGAEALEAGELRLDRDAGGAGGVDGRRAVRRDRDGGTLGR